jgi:carotenoid cleavage dioxygenase-like enzyme
MSELPFYMKDNYAPVEVETSATALGVEGQIPESLEGLYLRNGPNPSTGDPGHWFGGDGMIHGVRLSGGRAEWYRNRYVQTSRLRGDDRPMVSEDGVVDHTVGASNTNVMSHAGRIFALVETSFPVELSRELDTIGPADFDGKLASSFTAHPKICGKTGEMLAFGYGFTPPFLRYYRFSPDGQLLQNEAIEVPGPTMIHDFGVSENHVVFMDLPVCFSGERLAQGGMPYAWDPSYGARLGVMPRDGSNADLKWIEIDPCYVFHPLNTYEVGGQIVMDVARYESLWNNDALDFRDAVLTRWTIDLTAGHVKEEPLDDRAIEFPRLDPRLEGQPNRYGYAVGTDTADGIRMQRLLKYDLQSGSSEMHDFGPGSAPGEGVFVPASPGASEDEGYVLSYVYDAERNGSDLVVLDAGNFAAPPLARVKLPQRVPFGFHGNWVPDLA